MEVAVPKPGPRDAAEERRSSCLVSSYVLKLPWRKLSLVIPSDKDMCSTHVEWVSRRLSCANRGRVFLKLTFNQHFRLSCGFLCSAGGSLAWEIMVNVYLCIEGLSVSGVEAA